MSVLQIGSLAPDFTLKNQSGEDVSLRQFSGKSNILLYFYPKAATPGCTTQACGIRDSLEDFRQLDTVVLGVSPDPQIRLEKFIAKYHLNFDLLSDEDHGLADKYGVWALKKFMGREFMGIVRTSFLIDKEGRVRYVTPKVNTKTHHQDLIAYIKEHF